MKIVCSKKMLVNKIGMAQKAVSQKTSLEALKHLVLEASNNELVITGYDLDLGIIAKMEADVEVSGKVAINSRLFGEIVRKTPEDVLALEYLKEENKLLILSGKSTFQIVAGNLEEFPPLPTIVEESKFTLNSKDFTLMINETKMAISQDISKPILTGALMEVNENSVTMVALDGYRMAISEHKIETGVKDSKKVVIPGKTLNDVSSILGSNNLDIQFSTDVNDKYLCVEFEDVKIISRLLEGEYIEYRKLLPAEFKTEISVSRLAFLNAIERATILAAHEKNSLVKFSITDDFIQATTNSSMGDLSEQVDIDKTGDSLNIAFNSRYLTEALRALSCEHVTLKFTTNLNPCTIYPQDDRDYVYLLLPIRLASGQTV